MAMRDLRTGKMGSGWLFETGVDSPELWLDVCGLDADAFRDEVRRICAHDRSISQEELQRVLKAIEAVAGTSRQGHS